MVLIFHGHAGDGEDRIAKMGFRLIPVEIDTAANHQIRHFLYGSVTDPAHVDELPVAENRTAVGNLPDFLDLMGDEDDGFSVFPEAVNDLQEKINFLRCEYGCRLIEDHDFRLAVQHFQDLNPLPDRDGQVFDPVGRIDFQPEFFGELADFVVCFFQVNPGQEAQPALHGFDPEHDILCYGVIVNQLEMLMDHTDAVCGSIIGRMEDNRLSVDQDRPVIRLIHAEQHAHQSGFTRSVFTEERIYLAPPDGDRNIIVCHDTGKAFRDMTHLNYIIIHGSTSKKETPCPSGPADP